MSPLAITRPSQPLCASPSGPGRVGMRLSAYFGKRLHGMLSRTHAYCKHAHLYRSASAAGWLTPRNDHSQPATRTITYGHRQPYDRNSSIDINQKSSHSGSHRPLCGWCRYPFLLCLLLRSILRHIISLMPSLSVTTPSSP